MLWFDNDTKSSLEARIQRAVSYYRAKYGRQPTLCYLHPSMLPNGSTGSEGKITFSKDGERAESSAKQMIGGVEVRPHRSILPNHFWIGVN